MTAAGKLQLASYGPQSALWSLCDMSFLSVLGIAQKLWPPDVYHACSKEIKSGMGRK